MCHNDYTYYKVVGIMESTHKHPLVKATVVQVFQESSTIKRLVLETEDVAHLSFKAGQWVDFHIAGVPVFTGYSMCSAPHTLQDSGTLELAVKHTDYPPTLWVHTQCKIGDQVHLRVGGTFFHEITPHTEPLDLLLVAAGIGINPIYSIFQHFVHMQSQSQATTRKLCLLYSAQTIQELVFKDEIVSMAKTCPNVKVLLFSTRQQPETRLGEGSISGDRISGSVIKTQTDTMDKARLHSYICGPPLFIDDIERYCLDEGLSAQQIHYEKWW